MSGDELTYLTALNTVFRYQGGTARTLVDHFGSAAGIFRYSAAELSQISGLSLSTTSKLVSPQTLDEAQQEIEWACQQGIRTYAIHESSYPKRLFHCPDAPVLLYQSGPANLSTEKILAVVGTRKATAYGRQITARLIHGLAKRGHHCMIVSGLAYGIDIEAHRIALEAELPTVAVFASGLDHVQPSAHYSVAQKIKETGACISDFPSKTGIVKSNFLKRNRIIAGIADGVIVIESQKKGGALITAEIAQSYNREVMAVPGRIGDPCSEGCNYLIKEQQAALVHSAEDIEHQLGWLPSVKEAQPVARQEQDLIDFSLLQALEKGPLSIDQMYRISGIPLPELSARLMRLILKGSVKRLQQNQYCLV